MSLVADGVSVRFGGRMRFLKLVSAFTADPPFAASFCCHDSISRAVNEDSSNQRKIYFGVANPAFD